jgi:hypothetical protein
MGVDKIANTIGAVLCCPGSCQFTALIDRPAARVRAARTGRGTTATGTTTTLGTVRRGGGLPLPSVMVLAAAACVRRVVHGRLIGSGQIDQGLGRLIR